MKGVRGRRGGFTLVELLVVIAIITVLIAIALPVFSRVREKARQTACMANLHQIAMAIRMYRMDMGSYPGPYDPVFGTGAVNALYPAYLDNRKALICPDDIIQAGQDYVAQKVRVYENSTEYRELMYATLLLNASTLYIEQDPTGNYWLTQWRGDSPEDPDDEVDPGFFQEHYSSYNDLYNWVGYVGTDKEYSLVDLGAQYLHKGDNLAFWYSWHRWDPENDLEVWSSPEAYDLVDTQLHYHLAQQTYWSDYDPWNLEAGQRLLDALHRALWDPANPNPEAEDYLPYGMPSPVFPGLMNRNAPDNTIVTRCIQHRPYTAVSIRTRTGPPDEGERGPRGPAFKTEYVRSESPQDIVLRLDGSAALVIGLSYDWATQPRGTQ